MVFILKCRGMSDSPRNSFHGVRAGSAIEDRVSAAVRGDVLGRAFHNFTFFEFVCSPGVLLLHPMIEISCNFFEIFE